MAHMIISSHENAEDCAAAVRVHALRAGQLQELLVFTSAHDARATAGTHCCSLCRPAGR